MDAVKHDFLGMKKTISSIFFLGITHGVILLSGIMSAVLWSRFMTLELYGEYKVVWAILGFVGIFCYSGIGQAALKASSNEIDGNFIKLSRLKLRANLIGGLVLLCFATFYAFQKTEDLNIPIALVIMGLLFPAYNLSDIWGSWLNGKQNFRILNFGRICLAYVPLIALLVLIAIGISELWIVIAISFIALTSLNVYMWHLASRYRKNNLQNSEWIAYSKRSSFALSFGAILTLEPVLLEQYYGAAEVAVYAIALLLPDQVKVFFGLINQACATRIHRHVRLKTLLKDLRFIFVTLYIASIAVALIGFFTFQDVIVFLFSNKYSEAGHIGKWLWLFALMTAPINTFLGFIIQSRQHMFSTYIGGIGYPLLLVFFIFVFIDMGVMGLIIARILLYILTSIFHCITILWLLRREINEEN